MINRTVRAAGASSSSGDAGRAPNGARMAELRGNGVQAWSPTVANILVLTVLEIVAFAVIRYVFKRVTD